MISFKSRFGRGVRVSVLGLVLLAAISVWAIGGQAIGTAPKAEAAVRAQQIGLHFGRWEYYSFHPSPISNVVVQGYNQNGAWAVWSKGGIFSSAHTTGWWWADGWIRVSARCANTGAWWTRWLYKDTRFLLPWINTWNAIFVTNC